MDFIDIQGAAADYRFRPWPERGDHVPMAGNYVVVKIGSRPPEPLVIGVTNDLSRLAAKVRSLKPGQKLFTRLNVARASREDAHADLVARRPDAQVEVDAV